MVLSPLASEGSNPAPATTSSPRNWKVPGASPFQAFSAHCGDSCGDFPRVAKEGPPGLRPHVIERVAVRIAPRPTGVVPGRHAHVAVAQLAAHVAQLNARRERLGREGVPEVLRAPGSRRAVGLGRAPDSCVSAHLAEVALPVVGVVHVGDRTLLWPALLPSENLSSPSREIRSLEFALLAPGSRERIFECDRQHAISISNKAIEP